MIAYNHYIKFIPEVKNDKDENKFYLDVITVKESTCSFDDIDKKLQYELPFFSNQGRELMLYGEIKFNCNKKGKLWAFEIKNVVTFFWNCGSMEVEYIRHANFTEKLLIYWCLHIFLPIFFTIEETYDFLHAGAVEVIGKPILFVAESFGGKSTITDFFMKQGHALISDDKVATYEKSGEIFAVSSHPHHRPYRKMEDIGYFVDNFSQKSKQIKAIYRLKKADENAKIEIREAIGIEKFKILRLASETNLYHQKIKRFEYLTKMATIVNVFIITVPWNLERLSEVYHEILNHQTK